MVECCGNCKYFHSLKIGERYPIVSSSSVTIGRRRGRFDITSCCVVHAVESDDYDSFIIETTENDMCEMFTERK